MLRVNQWNKSVSRVEVDQRARDARLRLERIERLLVTRDAVVTYSRLRRLLCLFKVGIQYGERRLSRSKGPLRNRRSSRTLTIHEIGLEMCSSCG